MLLINKLEPFVDWKLQCTRFVAYFVTVVSTCNLFYSHLKYIRNQ